VKDRIQAWASMVLGAGVILLVGWLTMEQMGRTHIHAEAADAGANAGANANANANAGANANANGNGGAGAADSGPAAGTGTTTGALDTTGDGGFSLVGHNTLLDAGAMPSGAPRSVRLGVVLVQFAGAEGASSSARAKPDALKHAVELAEQAKTDWKAAVKAGDVGSSDDIGRIPRGVLDHSTELVVFSLEKDGISEPLETPKGYWIVRRVE
jgi:hypothetical protein